MIPAHTSSLSGVADVVRGVSFDKEETISSAREGYLPVLRAGNISNALVTDRGLIWVPSARVRSTQRLQVGDIAICMSSGSQEVVGKTAPLRHSWQGSVGAFCAIVRPRPEKIDPAFLAFFMQAEVFRAWTRQSSGANIKNIRKSELEAFPIRIPPLDEQLRVVDLLSRADGIVRLCREAQKKAAEIIPALFLDMFGDPATNPKGWAVPTLGEVILAGPQNGLYKHKSAYGGGTPILRIDAFYDGVVLDISSLKRLRLQDDELMRYGLAQNDLVINRVNSPEYLGKSAVLPALKEPTVFESNIMRFTLDTHRILPGFVIAFLQTRAARQHLLSKAKHAINQSSINQQDVKSLPVPQPPLLQQEIFVRHCALTEAIAAQQAFALDKAEAAFHALLGMTFQNKGIKEDAKL